MSGIFIFEEPQEKTMCIEEGSKWTKCEEQSVLHKYKLYIAFLLLFTT